MVTSISWLSLFLLAAVAPRQASGAVLKATSENFIKDIAGAPEVSLIRFTSAKCEAHKGSVCQNFEPEWKKLADSLKRMKVWTADIDTEDGKKLAQNLQVFNEGFPNIKLFNFKQPPAETLMSGELKTAKAIRIQLKSFLHGFEKNSDGFFLKGDRTKLPGGSSSAASSGGGGGGGSSAAPVDDKLDTRHYDVLGLKPTATAKEIRKAYRKLSVRYHPDKSAEGAKNKKKFAAITEANRILSEPDLRKLYHAYGPDFGNAEMNQYRRNNFGHKHKDVIFFQDTDGVRNFESKDGDELDGGLKKHTVLFIYSPWYERSQHVMQTWKQMPDLLKEQDFTIGAINCDATTLCREFGINQIPSIQIWALGEKTIDTYPDNNGMDDYAPEKVAHWLKANVEGRGLIHTDINKKNFEAKVLNSPDPWMVVLCANPMRYPICHMTRKTFNRMAYIVHKAAGVKLAYIECGEEKKDDGIWLDEWCEVDMGVKSMGEDKPWSFPFIKLYKRGTNKGGGEDVDLNVKEPKFQGDKLIQDQVLDILEKVVQFAAPDPESLKKKPDDDFDFESDADEDDEEGEKKDEL